MNETDRKIFFCDFKSVRIDSYINFDCKLTACAIIYRSIWSFVQRTTFSARGNTCSVSKTTTRWNSDGDCWRCELDDWSIFAPVYDAFYEIAFRFWHIDNLVRILFYIFLFIVGIILLTFIFDRDYLFQLIIDIYYSAKFLITNNLVIRPDVISRCNRSWDVIESI